MPGSPGPAVLGRRAGIPPSLQRPPGTGHQVQPSRPHGLAPSTAHSLLSLGSEYAGLDLRCWHVTDTMLVVLSSNREERKVFCLLTHSPREHSSQGEDISQELHPGLPCGWQGPPSCINRELDWKQGSQNMSQYCSVASGVPDSGLAYCIPPPGCVCV